jgi:diguanylate cyclase (GGDEF)-like protein
VRTTFGGKADGMMLRRRFAPAVLVAVLLGLISALALVPLSPLTTARLSWLASVGLSVATLLGARATMRRLPRDDPARRFWYALGVNAVAVGAGYLVALAGTDITLGPVTQVLAGLGALVVVVVMLTYPLPMHSGRERFCFWLDMATVMVAAAAVGWYVSDPAAGLGTGALAVLSGPVIMLVAVFAVAKLLIAGRPPFTAVPGLLGAGSAVVATVLTVAGATLLEAAPGVFFALSAFGDLLLMVAAWLQSRQIEHRPHLLERRRRPYSALPYAAVAGTFVLLWMALRRAGLEERTWAVLAGAVICVALVVIRQLASFAENSRLLGALDRKVRELHRTEAVLRAALEERDALAAELREMAFHDRLTGLSNRAFFHDRLVRLLAAAGPRVAVIYLDLDDFKPVNDRYGHNAGDEVLRQVGARIKGCVRATDTVSRLGGDEFAVILHESDAADVGAVAQRILATLRQPYWFGGVPLTVGVSIGTVVCPNGTEDADELLNLADLAMYQAKHNGKNSVHAGSA